MNYRLLGFRLSERSQVDTVHAVVDKVIQVFRDLFPVALIFLRISGEFLFLRKNHSASFLRTLFKIFILNLICVFYLMISQVIIQYGGLDEYLKVVDAYVDIVLQNHMVRLSMFLLQKDSSSWYAIEGKKVPVGCDAILVDWFFTPISLFYFNNG